MGWLERMDERNQRHCDRANVLMSNENYEKMIAEERARGLTWAWFISPIPVVGLIGVAAITIDGWRRSRRRRDPSHGPAVR